MRGKLLFLIAVLLLVFCCAFALAEPEGPVDPDLEMIEVWSQVESPKYSVLYSTRNYSPKSADTVVWSWDNPPDPEDIGYDQNNITFTVHASDGETYLYEYYFGENGSVFGNSWVVYRQQLSTLNSFTICPILVADDYLVIANVYDITDTKKTNRLHQLQYRFSMPEDAEHPTVETLCDEVLAGCQATTQFDIALYLHDWITHHMYYDNSKRFYGAEGALKRGYGTCDSYSKAYYLLLEKAGIPVVRISSNNHAWVRIKLDNVWYQIDPTWDDPVSSNIAVTGNENHEYFCVTDALMLASGHNYTPDSSAPCESLTMNYFAVRGGWEDWQIGFLDELRAGMQLGRPGLGASCPGETMRHLKILCSILNEQPQWTADMADGQSLIFQYNYGDTIFSVALADAGTLSGYWLYELTDQGAIVKAWLGVRAALSIPAAFGEQSVTGIGERAFRGDTRLTNLSVPQSLLSIGEQALDGCTNLTNLTFPETVNMIGSEALPEGTLLTCARNSSLAQALGGAGYPFADSLEPEWKLQWVEDEVLAALQYNGMTDVTDLPEGVNGLGNLDLGGALLLRADTVVWTDTDGLSVDPPAIVLCGNGSTALEAWCSLNDVSLLTEADRTTLPAALSAIEAEAFSGAAFRWVVIPEGTTSIGANSFAGCNQLKLVSIPSSVHEIGDGAFGNGVFFLTTAGSDAETWAVANGLTPLTE